VPPHWYRRYPPAPARKPYWTCSAPAARWRATSSCATPPACLSTSPRSRTRLRWGQRGAATQPGFRTCRAVVCAHGRLLGLLDLLLPACGCFCYGGGGAGLTRQGSRGEMCRRPPTPGVGCQALHLGAAHLGPAPRHLLTIKTSAAMILGPSPPPDCRRGGAWTATGCRAAACLWSSRTKTRCGGQRVSRRRRRRRLPSAARLLRLRSGT
jgi:hypothetical protein